MDIIHAAYVNSVAIYANLLEHGDVSDASAAQELLSKYLVLCCASFFEERIKELLKDFFKRKTSEDILAQTFVAKKAIEKEFHKNFDWNSDSASHFFAFFGDDFKTEMKNFSSTNPKFKQAMKDFMNIGAERNKLVHRNLVAANTEWTLPDIYQKAQSANEFVTFLRDKLFATPHCTP